MAPAPATGVVAITKPAAAQTLLPQNMSTWKASQNQKVNRHTFEQLAALHLRVNDLVPVGGAVGLGKLLEVPRAVHPAVVAEVPARTTQCAATSHSQKLRMMPLQPVCHSTRVSHAVRHVCNGQRIKLHAWTHHAVQRHVMSITFTLQYKAPARQPPARYQRMQNLQHLCSARTNVPPVQRTR
jgi:hypothetical protein